MAHISQAGVKKIHEICEKLNLRYYLAYGTLIGAIRHQGNTICAVVMAVQILFNVSFSYLVMMLLPMIYMILFVKAFHNELVNHGIEGFIEHHDLKNAKVVSKKYDSNGNLESSEDLLEKGSDKLNNESDEKSSDKDDNNKNNKSGYFAP